MRFLREQVLVENCDLQIRDLQTTDQRLDLRRQISILKNEFEQHADQIDRILVRGRNAVIARRSATQPLRLFEHLLLELLNDLGRVHHTVRVCLIDLGLALQNGQRAEQIRRAQVGHATA